MLPLMVLAGLVGAGFMYNRYEQAESEEAPPVEHEQRAPRKDGAMPLPYKPPRTKKSPTWDDLKAQREQKLAPRHSEASVLDHNGNCIPEPVGPMGNGPMAHFTESQVGTISQAPAQLARAGAGVDPALHAAGIHVKRETTTSGPPQANRLVASPMAGVDAERKRYSLPYSKAGSSPFDAQREKPLGETSNRLRAAATPRDLDTLRGAANPKNVQGGRFTAAPFGFNVPGKPGEFTTQRRIGSGSGVPGESAGHFGTGAAAVRRGAPTGDFFVPQTRREGQEGQFGQAARAIGSMSSFGGNEMRHTSPDIMSLDHSGFVAGGPRGRDRCRDMSMYGASVGSSFGRGAGAPRLGAAHAAPMGTRSPLQMQNSKSSSSCDSATRKSLLTPSARHFGEVQIASNPPKQTVFEPEPLRTTMRETSTHDTHEGMLRGASTHSEARSPDTVARPTVRETIGDLQGSHGDGHLDGTVSLSTPPVYDPYDLFDTTVKETTEVNTHMGNISGKDKAQGPGELPSVSSTQRGYDASVGSDYFGNAAHERGDAYLAHSSVGGSIAWSAPDTTNRDINVCTDYRGAAGAANKAFPSDDSAYTRVIGDAKERILQRRSPNGRKQILSPGAVELGSQTTQRNPCTDTQSSRLIFQNQHQWQQMKQADTCEDTRGGRAVHESVPETSALAQLATNPYAVQSKGVI